MEVIGAGWGRTGTLSLKTALETLGFPCYHMIDCLLVHKDHQQLWMKAADGEPVDFEQMLAGYKACVDWPAVSFYKELLELYPDAKVILTVRDPAKWYTSVVNTVYKMHKVLRGVPWYVMAVLSLGGAPNSMPMMDKIIYNRDFKGLAKDQVEAEPEKVQQLFLKHIEEVKQVVPADRLLVYEVSQGWEPLCAFLGKPVPDQPFPHVNDTESWEKRIVAFQRTATMLSYGLPAAAVGLLAVVVWTGLRRW